MNAQQVGSRALRCAGLVAVLMAVACGSGKPEAINTGRARSLGLKGVGGERCDASVKGRQVSEYDTSGDKQPDIRKVLLSIGEGVDARRVMICRETDVDGDGRKDVIRYYDDDGRSLREEADRNFDGRMDLAVVFQDGKIVRKEVDENNDGKIDTRIFYENAKPMRAERDLAGRSTDTTWHPDRWEYYENGDMVRMGTDLDGDSRVDRWDRDAKHKTDDEAETPDAGAAGGSTDTSIVED